MGLAEGFEAEALTIADEVAWHQNRQQLPQK
jgi:hypothetical protein